MPGGFHLARGAFTVAVVGAMFITAEYRRGLIRTALYTPNQGFFPLAPWAGFAVLCGCAVAALAAAIVTLRRRDA